MQTEKWKSKNQQLESQDVLILVSMNLEPRTTR